jgi:hypothetical protein
MAICEHGRSIGNCPLCPVKPAQPAIAAPTTTQTFAGTPPPSIIQLSDKPDVPAITDPTARLAQEYAQELENMAAIRAALANMRSMVHTLQIEEADAQKKCSAVFKQLQASMVPAPPKGARKKKVEIREKERPAIDSSEKVRGQGGSSD